MSEYKRLTNNNLEEYNPEYDFCVGCKYFGEPNGCNRPNGTCGNYDRFLETYSRLAELEDKIDNGTLLELPCKVGDKVYKIEYNYWEVCHDCPHFSTFFGMDENCDMGYETYPNPKKLNANCKKHELQLQENIFSIEFYARHFNDFGKTVFITRAESEAKLKELQEEKNDKERVY